MIGFSLSLSSETQPKSRIVEEKKCIDENPCPWPAPALSNLCQFRRPGAFLVAFAVLKVVLNYMQ